MIEYSLHLNNFPELCDTLWEEGIHNNGRMLNWYVDSSRKEGEYQIQAISTASIGSRIIAGCILLAGCDKFIGINIGVYVKPNYRRKKIGSELVKMIQYLNKKPLVWKGSTDAQHFFESLSL